MNRPKESGQAEPADGWRSADIAAPRPLGGPTYTVIATRDAGEEIVARHATLAKALFVALELRGGCVAAMVYRDRGDFRQYVIGRRRRSDGVFEPVLQAVVPRTSRIENDHVRALEFFEEIMQQDCRVFFCGRLARTKPSPRRAGSHGEAT
jgi:hypothetical protein